MNFIVEKDYFENLTIEKKTQLYKQFVDEISENNPDLKEHASQIEFNTNRANVFEDLDEDLETSLVFFEEPISSFELLCNTNSAEPNADDNQPEAEFIIDKELLETVQKRSSSQMHSSISIEAHAPSKRLRRSSGAEMRTRLGFPNEKLENLFFNWLKEKRQKNKKIGNIKHQLPHLSNNIDIAQIASGELVSKNVSHFWVKTGDFFLSVEIDHIDSESLQQTYKNFCKTSNVTKDIYFGIDQYKFTIDFSYAQFISFRFLPVDKDISKYWFATGDLVIRFNGKHMSSEKILRFFGFLKANVENTSILRFGIDKVDFSHIEDFWSKLEAEYTRYSNNFVLPGTSSCHYEYEKFEEGAENKIIFSLQECDSSECSEIESYCSCESMGNSECCDCENVCQWPCEFYDNSRRESVSNKCENHHCDTMENDCSSCNSSHYGSTSDLFEFYPPSRTGSVYELCSPISLPAETMNQLCSDESVNLNQQILDNNHNYDRNEEMAVINSNCDINQRAEAIMISNDSTTSTALINTIPITCHLNLQIIDMTQQVEVYNNHYNLNEEIAVINPNCDTNQRAEEIITHNYNIDNAALINAEPLTCHLNCQTHSLNQQTEEDNNNYYSNEETKAIDLDRENNRLAEAITIQDDNTTSTASISAEPITCHLNSMNQQVEIDNNNYNHCREVAVVNRDFDTNQQSGASNENTNINGETAGVDQNSNGKKADHHYQDPMQTCLRSSSSSDMLNAVENALEFCCRLRSMVAKISKISDTDVYQNSSVEQLETFICLLSQSGTVCIDHMDRIANLLLKKTSNKSTV